MIPTPPGSAVASSAIVQAKGCIKVLAALFPAVHLCFPRGKQGGNRCPADTPLICRQISSSVSFWHLISYSQLPLCLCTMLLAHKNGSFLMSVIYIKTRRQALWPYAKTTAFKVKKNPTQ